MNANDPVSRTLIADQLLTYAVREGIAALKLVHVLRRRGLPAPEVGVIEAVADMLCSAAVDAEFVLMVGNGSTEGAAS